MNGRALGWVSFVNVQREWAGYLLGSEHVRDHRKQTSIADAETHALLLENLKLKRQLIGASSVLRGGGGGSFYAGVGLRCAGRGHSALCAPGRSAHRSALDSKPGEPGRCSTAEKEGVPAPVGCRHQHRSEAEISLQPNLLCPRVYLWVFRLYHRL